MNAIIPTSCAAARPAASIRRLNSMTGVLLAGAAIAAPNRASAQTAQPDIMPPKVNVMTPGGVNISNGAFIHSVTDLSIGGLTLERFHLTGRKPNDPFFGRNMSHNFDIYVASNYKQATAQPLARPERYEPIVHIGASASGVYWQSISDLSSITAMNRDARAGTLEWVNNNHYVYTDQGGTIYTFSPTISAVGVPFRSQRISTIRFPDGRVQSFSYNLDKHLKLVTDSAGYAFVFDYNGDGDVTAACAFNTAETYVSSSSTCASATLKTTYGYDVNEFLTSAVDVRLQTTNYANSAWGVTCVRPPAHATCQLSMTYDGQGRVTQQTMADGGIWSIGAGHPEIMNDPSSLVADGDNVGGFTDPAGHTTSYTFTKNSPYTITDANGRETQYRFTGGVPFDYVGTPFSDGSLLTDVILPEENRFRAEYDGPYNSVSRQVMIARPGTDLPDRETESVYPSCFPPNTRANCTKPIAVRDTNGNQTDFTYNAAGQVLTEMRPAPESDSERAEQQLPPLPRPLKVYTYALRYAVGRTSAGGLQTSTTGMSMPATETVCQTVAGSSSPQCDPAAPITVTTYEYGAAGTVNSLRLLGTSVSSGGQTRRSCVTYDSQGNRLSETQPRGTGASCP